NKRQLFSTSIGLIIACLVFSQAYIISISYQQYAFDDFIEGKDESAINFYVEKMSNNSFFVWEERLNDNYEKWVSDQNLELIDMINFGSLSVKIITGVQNNTEALERKADVLYVNTRGWNRYIFELFKLFPSFPLTEYNPEDSLLVLPSVINITSNGEDYFTYEPEDFLNVTDQVEFDLLAGYSLKSESQRNYNDSFSTLPYSTKYVWQLTNLDINYMLNKNLNIPSSYLNSIYIPIGEEWSLHDELTAISLNDTNRQYTWGKPNFETFIYVNREKLYEISLDDYAAKINNLLTYITTENKQFFDDMESYLINNNVEYSINSNLLELINIFNDDDFGIYFTMLISSLPLILVSLILLNFSLNLIERKKEENMSKMLVRGASVFQLRVIILAEVFTTAVISPLIGFFLALPLSSELTKTTDILEFNNEPIPLLIPNSLYWRLPLIGFFLAVQLNLPKLFQLREITVEDVYINADESKFNRHTFYTVLSILSILYWLIIPNVEFAKELDVAVYNQMGIVMLGCTMLGIPYLISHHGISLLNYIFSKMEKGFDTLHLAITNIHKYKHFTSRLIILMLLGMILSYAALISSNTMIEIKEEDSLYQLGAEIYIEGLDFTNPILYEKVNIEGVASTTPIMKTSYVFSRHEVPAGESPEDYPIYTFLGVNTSTFAETAFWKSNYAKESIEQIMDSLNGPDVVGLQKDVAAGIQAYLDRPFNLVHGFRAKSSFTLQLNATFDYFPNLVNELPSFDNEIAEVETIQVLGTLEMVQSVSTILNENIIQGIYIKVQDGYDVQKIAEKLYYIFSDDDMISVYNYIDNQRSLFSDNPFDTPETIENVLISYENRLVLSGLHMILLVAFAITVIAITYYSFTFIKERTKEIGIYRA
ncbi:MAG: ABC transporter permease, partial [Candidatus Heimdallarchaeota archaeon]|nr:ABC transporter permease [Candidatus Heimdallarchaeota archaeon]